MDPRNVYIVGAARTPVGAFLGSLSALSAPTLGSIAIRAALERARVTGAQVDEVYMGNVLSAGAGQAPARQASIVSGVPDVVPCVTVNKVCGSGLYSVILGTRSIALGDAEIVVGGGMESMSNAPYLLPRARAGYRMGNAEVVDSMLHDGLWDPYHNFHMGSAGELCAREYGFSRADQDAFALESYRRARAAQASGAFKDEIVPVPIERKGAVAHVDEDEEPGRAPLEKMPSLRPAFEKDGTITAANAAKVNDGAAALVLASERAVSEHGLTPLARVVSYGVHAQAPDRFTTAPVGAVSKALRRAEIAASDVGLWEVNEAFAVVSLACGQQIGIPSERMNVHGGAVAIGHPIGASGARVLVTLLHAMRARQERFGLATLCVGGGEGVALVVERV